MNRKTSFIVFLHIVHCNFPKITLASNESEMDRPFAKSKLVRTTQSGMK